MPRQPKCGNCQAVKTEKSIYRCYNCGVSGCSECIKTACCDCSERMCRNCSGSGEPNCGCYGTCCSCGTDVNRGSDGWPCYKCEKWYCQSCKHFSKCEECRIDDDDESDDN